MRILQVCPYAWDMPGGVQVHVRQLASQLRGTGHEVEILAPAVGHPSEEGVRIVGRARRIPYQGTVAPICFSPVSLPRIGGALRAFRPDVVHVHEPMSPSTAMFAALRSRAPVVATFHAFTERSRLLDVAVPFLRPVWRNLAARIAVSETAAGFVSARFGDGIRVVPNGLDVDMFRGAEPAPRPPGRMLLWVGRLDRQKGFPIAVDAFAELAQEFDDLRFVVVGDGRDRDDVRRLDPSARERVTMVGAVPNAEVPRHYAAADVFVAPATGQETFGYVLIEAMAAGVPVVASRIPGYDEVVRHGVDGLLVRPSDAHALAGAVEQVLREPDLADNLREAGRERATEYSWDRVAAQLEEIYRGVAETGAPTV
ncbi:MAG: glycosyltransferase family 4 protein [Actinomycetota bacterium]